MPMNIGLKWNLLKPKGQWNCPCVSFSGELTHKCFAFQNAIMVTFSMRHVPQGSIWYESNWKLCLRKTECWIECPSPYKSLTKCSVSPKRGWLLSSQRLSKTLHDDAVKKSCVIDWFENWVSDRSVKVMEMHASIRRIGVHHVNRVTSNRWFRIDDDHCVHLSSLNREQTSEGGNWCEWQRWWSGMARICLSSASRWFVHHVCLSYRNATQRDHFTDNKNPFESIDVYLNDVNWMDAGSVARFRNYIQWNVWMTRVRVCVCVCDDSVSNRIHFDAMKSTNAAEFVTNFESFINHINYKWEKKNETINGENWMEATNEWMTVCHWISIVGTTAWMQIVHLEDRKHSLLCSILV